MPLTKFRPMKRVLGRQRGFNAAVDYLITLGVAFGGLDTHRIFRDGDFLKFEDVDTGTVSTLRQLLERGGGGHIGVSLGGGASQPGIETPSTNYELVAHMLWPGSTEAGAIDKIEAVAMTEDGADPIAIKIFDITNGNTVAEKTGFAGATDGVFEVVDLGTISNVPSAKAVFEIQIKKDGTGNPSPGWISAVDIDLI